MLTGRSAQAHCDENKRQKGASLAYHNAKILHVMDFSFISTFVIFLCNCGSIVCDVAVCCATLALPQLSQSN